MKAPHRNRSSAAARTEGPAGKTRDLDDRRSDWRSRAALGAFLGLAFVSWFVFTNNYTPDDSWFYLVIARNLVLSGQQTFSGLFPTNGFHPLWQYLVAGWAWLVYHLRPDLLDDVRYVTPLSAACTILGAWQLAVVCRRLRLNPLGLVYIPTGFVTLFGVLYTEAHALFAAVAVLMRLSLTGPIDRPLGPLWCGLAAGAVFLARLDSMMFVGCYALWFLLVKRRAKDALLFGAGLSAVAAPYLAGNLIWFGSAMPVSGWMKSSFPRVFAKGFGNAGLAKTLWGCNIAFSLAPTALAGPALLWARRASAESRHFGVALAAGCALQVAYVALFTRSHTDWYWYSVLPVMLGGFWASIALSEFSLRKAAGQATTTPRQATSRAASLAGRAGLVLLAAGWVAVTAGMRWRPHPMPEMFRVDLDYMAKRGIDHATLLVSDHPGYLALKSPDNYIVAADMLTSNRAFYEEMRRHPNALQYMVERFREEGHPLRLVVYVRQTWLAPDDNLRGITFNDPRTYPELKPIGHLDFPKGPAVILREDGELSQVIWDLADQSPAPEATPPGK